LFFLPLTSPSDIYPLSLHDALPIFLSAFGIVIGIGAFVLFLALTQRAGTVLEKIFPLDEVQVVAPRVSLLGKDASKRLDDATVRSEEHTSELQSLRHLVCRLLLEKK